MSPLFSIIIACKQIGEYERECVQHCLNLKDCDFELILLPDSQPPREFNDPRLRIFATGPVKPSVKRNIGVARSSGSFIAIIDSDAYPDGQWLENAVKYFDDKSIGAVGGPGLTPPHDGLRARASGCVLASRVGGGGLSYRYRIGRGAMVVDDLPTFNLIVPREVFEAVGGFNVDFWPGEDTYFCLQIQRAGRKLIYAPDVVVYHHPRPLFRRYLRQIRGYGLHRGFYAKRYPENSRRPIYFVPSIFVSSLIAGSVLASLHQVFLLLYLGFLMVYFGSCAFEAAKARPVKLSMMVFAAIFLTHIW